MNAITMKRDDMAIAGQAGGIITKEQVRDLILAATAAHKVQAKLGLAEEPFNVWRKSALHDACGRQSFRDVRQSEYGKTLKYLLLLAGKHPEQRPAAAKSRGQDEAGRARWALDGECKTLADAFGSENGARTYAETLLGRIHKTTWHGATAKQLWQVLFTMRNRGKAKARKNAL